MGSHAKPQRREEESDANIARLEKHLARIVAHLAAAPRATPQITAKAARLCASKAGSPAPPPRSKAHSVSDGHPGALLPASALSVVD